MKKAASLFLLIPVLLHSGGIMLICMLLQLNVHSTIEQILENPGTRFEKLKLSTESYLKNKIDDKEIIVDGKIYDIKNIIFHKGYVELLAYNDSEEQSLISAMENFFSGSTDSKSDYPVQVLKLLVAVYTLPKQEIKFSRNLTPHAIKSFVLETYLSFSDEPFSPPPEVTG